MGRKGMIILWTILVAIMLGIPLFLVWMQQAIIETMTR
jgi:nitrate reductase NapE component